MAAGAVSFVAKPYRIQQIAQKLREALDRHPAAGVVDPDARGRPDPLLGRGVI